MKEGEQRPAAAGGRKRRGAVSAAVEKRKEQRKPAAFFGHRKAGEPSFKTPLRCTDLKDFGLRTLFLAGAAVAAPVFCTRSDHISRGGGCRPCEEGCSEMRTRKPVQRQGGSKEGRSPLLCRFKDGVQGKGNRNPFPWRAFSFCPLSLCTSKEKMDSDQPVKRQIAGRRGARTATVGGGQQRLKKSRAREEHRPCFFKRRDLIPFSPPAAGRSYGSWPRARGSGNRSPRARGDTRS